MTSTGRVFRYGPYADDQTTVASHPIICSLEPGEGWSWCYVDEVAMLLDEVHGTTRIPRSPLMYD